MAIESRAVIYSAVVGSAVGAAGAYAGAILGGAIGAAVSGAVSGAVVGASANAWGQSSMDLIPVPPGTEAYEAKYNPRAYQQWLKDQKK